MAAAEKVIALAREPWGDEIAPLLRRVYGERECASFDGVVAAIKSGAAVLYVARLDGVARAFIVLAVKKFPLRELCVVAMAAEEHSGVHWARAGWDELRALGAELGAACIGVNAETEATRRLYAVLGFVPRSTDMVAWL